MIPSMAKNIGHLTLKIFLLIVLNDIADTLAQFLMKKGLMEAGPFIVTLGILVYALNFLVWITILYKVDLSIAMPVGSTSYILIPLVAMLFLHEHISPLRWLGIIMIVLGIYFVSRSKKPVLPEGISRV